MKRLLCYRCSRTIELRDLGPTMHGEPLLRWSPVERGQLVTCLVETGRYCSPDADGDQRR